MNKVDRRGFLGAIMAVTAACAGGVKLPKGSEVKKAPPNAIAVQNKLLEILKECAAVSISVNSSVAGPMACVVEYVHLPGSKKNDDTLMVEQYTRSLRPVSINFVQAAGELSRLTVEWM